MANKFQKSVLERLEQEAVRQKEKTKIKASEPKTEETISEKTEAIETVPAAPEVEPQTAEPQEPVNKNELPVIPDIGDYLRRDNQRFAKNKTFYLDTDVIEAVKSTAKEQKVTDSKLVNDILRRVLGLS